MMQQPMTLDQALEMQKAARELSRQASARVSQLCPFPGVRNIVIKIRADFNIKNLGSRPASAAADGAAAAAAAPADAGAGDPAAAGLYYLKF